ncbi:MAG: hypothetical protein K0Q73_5321 [Paenibacillus sp.]|nr:hypothetical protein [Paenibacillus sp.]
MGDTLYAIAKQFYGDGNLNAIIYEANKNIIHTPELIFIGQEHNKYNPDYTSIG